jgi:two-component system response regulator NreC
VNVYLQVGEGRFVLFIHSHAVQKKVDMAIRVLLADDHKLIRESLSRFLQTQDDVEVVGEAKDGRTALELTEQLQPDIVIMDVSMPPVLSGLEATEWICSQWLSMHKHKQYVAEMLKAGARGYMLKDAGYDELLAAIHTVAQGGIYLSPGVDSIAPAEGVSLS